MTVETKMSIAELGQKINEDALSPSLPISYEESDVVINVNFFTFSQVQVFDHLSSLLKLNDESSRLLTDYCGFIARGEGVLSSDGFVRSPCKDALVIALENVYERNVQKNGVSCAITDYQCPKAIKKLLDDKEIASLLRRIMAENIMSKHSFAETGLMSLLASAREHATVPCVDFLWLKNADRILWYSLQSVGRKVCFLDGYMNKRIWEKEVALKKPLLSVVA